MTDRTLSFSRRLHSDHLDKIEINVMLLLENLKPDVVGDSGMNPVFTLYGSWFLANVKNSQISFRILLSFSYHMSTTCFHCANVIQL